MDEEQKRKLYVAITRAKKNLFVYYNNYTFDRYTCEGATKIIDSHVYGKPKELLLQFTHKEVVLDFFKDKKNMIQHLVGGMELLYSGGYLYVKNDGKRYNVAKFSKGAVGIIEQNRMRGYEIDKCYVRFVVGWKDKEDEKEYPIVLPDIYLQERMP